MEIFEWYFIAILGSLVICIGIAILRPTLRLLRHYSEPFFLWKIYYPHLPSPIPHRGTTRFAAILIAFYSAGNMICLIWKVANSTQLARRAAYLAVINLAPVMLGSRMNAVFDQCHLTLPAFSRAHRWMGRVVLVHTTVHVLGIAFSQGLLFETSSDIAGVTAYTLLLLLVVSSVIRDRLFEIFTKMHLTLSVGLLTMLFMHAPYNSIWEGPGIYLTVSAGLHLLTYVLRIGHICYRSTMIGKPTTLQIKALSYKELRQQEIPLSDAVHICISLSRKFSIYPGQYIYLCVPGLSRSSFAQSHPFYVCWWEDEGAEGMRIIILVQRRKGLSRRLILHASHDLQECKERRVLIEGPFGRRLDLSPYSTVLLFATSIGIAAQLPFLRHILQTCYRTEPSDQRIRLFWELEEEPQSAWVADYMNVLLESDSRRILDIQLYIRGSFIPRRRSSPPGKRISRIYKEMPVEELVRSSVRTRQGETLILICTNLAISSKIREVVSSMANKGVHAHELEFQPYQKGLLNNKV